MDDIPTIAQTRLAREIFLRGFEAHYPGLDPRTSLLGMQENKSEYITEKYGNKLIRIPTHKEKLFAFVCNQGLAIGLIIYMLIKY